MVTLSGEYRKDGKKINVIMRNDANKKIEVITYEFGQVTSGYLRVDGNDFVYLKQYSKDICNIIDKAKRGCSAKNVVPSVCGTGEVVSRHSYTNKKKETFVVDKLSSGDIADVAVSADDIELELYIDTKAKFPEIGEHYIKMSHVKKDFANVEEEREIVVRSIEEVLTMKENIEWIKDKKYYVINDNEVAENIFSIIDNYNGDVGFDVETTGLKMNMFSKINSDRKRELEQYNEENPNNKIKADKLVGFSFSVEDNVSYYFPCAHKKFKNLYEDNNIHKEIALAKAWEFYHKQDPYYRGDMTKYFRDTPKDQIGVDSILMGRVGNILTKKHIDAHHASFEWKTCWAYEVDLNIGDDSMLMHQLMYKYERVRTKAGQRSDLKFLSMHEFGIDQLGLNDFFPEYSEDESGTVKKKKGKRKGNPNIDFSLMSYEGTRLYAPTDSDVTRMLCIKYRKDMQENHADMLYIYGVELLNACAVGYMEFYGHHIDEHQIENTKNKIRAEKMRREIEIRELAGIASEQETAAYKVIMDCLAEKGSTNEYFDNLGKYCEQAENAILDNVDNKLNLQAPAQVSDLLFNRMGIQFIGDKPSVAKASLAQYLRDDDNDDEALNPIVYRYSEYKKKSTLLKMFFEKLPDFMYPGGFIFSDYKQVEAATGRMKSKGPNAQQYPSDITKIVSPRKGYSMIDADYSQIEYRILVAMAKEMALLQTFYNPDNDYHTVMASLMFGVPYAAVTKDMRKAAKGFNFGIPYGMGIKSLAIKVTGGCSPEQIEEAKVKYELYFKDQPNVRKFFEQVKEMAKTNQYTKTYFNRYRYYNIVSGDSRRVGAALRQAGNAVIQGTAADIFKIAVARLWVYIRQNKLYGDVLITNEIHDEILLEANAQKLNIQRVLSDLADCMTYEIKGFPPLYIGAGVGDSWYKAKGGNAEIHVNLLSQLREEAKTIPLYNEQPKDTGEIITYFDMRNKEFRRNKIASYLMDVANHGEALHPVIASNLCENFNFGIERGEMKLAEYTEEVLKKFIEVNGIDVGYDKFKAANTVVEKEVEVEDYEDEEDDELEVENEHEEYEESMFQLMEEKNELFGVSVGEIIAEFGIFLSVNKKICGIDTRGANYRSQCVLANVIEQLICDEADVGAMEVQFLAEGNVLQRTGIYVSGIKESDIRSSVNTLNITNNYTSK